MQDTEVKDLNAPHAPADTLETRLTSQNDHIHAQTHRYTLNDQYAVCSALEQLCIEMELPVFLCNPAWNYVTQELIPPRVIEWTDAKGGRHKKEVSGKTPHTKYARNGCKSATIDPVIVKSRRRKAPGANYGIATGSVSGVVMIGPDGEQGKTDLAQLERVYGTLPTTFTVKSGAGGEHKYFHIPPGVKTHNAANHRGTKIDIRGEGGYGVGPGSIHPVTGLRYELVSAPGTPIADLPLAWGDWLAKPVPVPKETHVQAVASTCSSRAPESLDTIARRAVAYLDKLPPAISGNGGSKATSKAAAVLVIGFGMSVSEAWPLMQSWNCTHCQPPWTDDELRRKLEWADAQGDVRGRLRDARDTDNISDAQVDALFATIPAPPSREERAQERAQLKAQAAAAAVPPKVDPVGKQSAVEFFAALKRARDLQMRLRPIRRRRGCGLRKVLAKRSAPTERTRARKADPTQTDEDRNAARRAEKDLAFESIPDLPTLIIALKTRCERWVCPFCRAVNVHEWLECTHRHFAAVRGSIWTLTVPSCDARAVIARLGRMRPERANFRRVTILGSHDTFFFDRPMPEAVEMSPRRALKQFEVALNSVESEARKPVGGCREWSKGNAKTEKRFELLCDLDDIRLDIGNLEEVTAKMLQCGWLVRTKNAKAGVKPGIESVGFYPGPDAANKHEVKLSLLDPGDIVFQPENSTPAFSFDWTKHVSTDQAHQRACVN